MTIFHGTRTRLRHTMRFEHPGQLSTTHNMRYSRSTQTVEILREDIDALNGKPGIAVECMDSKAAQRLRHLFPHPAFWIEVTDRGTWVVDKMVGGVPKHCILYLRPKEDTRDMREYDGPGGKARMLREGRVNRPILFLACPPLKIRTDEEREARRIREEICRAGDPRKQGRAKGELKEYSARAMRAGLIAHPVAV